MNKLKDMDFYLVSKRVAIYFTCPAILILSIYSIMHNINPLSLDISLAVIVSALPYVYFKSEKMRGDMQNDIEEDFKNISSIELIDLVNKGPTFVDRGMHRGMVVVDAARKELNNREV